MPDYQNGQIYTIRYRLDDSLLYVGSTTQPLHKRWGDHKSNAYNVNCNRYNMRIYQKIRETNDVDNWYIELYELHPCNNRNELNKKEGEIIRLLNANLNKVIAGRSQKEYKEDHREEIALMKQKWYQEHKNEHNKKGKEYREINKEKLNEYDRERYKTEKRKEYTRKRSAEKIVCECGCEVCKVVLNRHKSSQKHKSLIENKSCL